MNRSNPDGAPDSAAWETQVNDDPAGHRPGAVMVGWGGWLLAALAGGLLFVSFAGQYAYLYPARHQQAPAAVAAAMFDVGMIIFSLLALGLARAGKPARTERALIVACAAGSAAMNYAAADIHSPRSVAAFVAPPLFLAVVIDRVIAVVRRHVLGDDEASPWAPAGRLALGAVRAGGLLLLYSLRLALKPGETARGVRQAVLNATPLPVATSGDLGLPDFALAALRYFPEVLRGGRGPSLVVIKKTAGCGQPRGQEIRDYLKVLRADLARFAEADSEGGGLPGGVTMEALPAGPLPVPTRPSSSNGR